MPDIPYVSIGIKPSPSSLILLNSDKALCENYTNLGYDYVLSPITNAKYRESCKEAFRDFKDLYNKHNDEKIIDLNFLKVPFPNSSEVGIFTGDHTKKIVGLISSWVELDSKNQIINEFSLQVLANELSYANHIGLSMVLIAPPKNLNTLSIFTNNLNTALNKFKNLNISISLPICEEILENPITGEIVPVIDSLSTWDMWNSIRLQCNYNENLSVSLALPKKNIPQYIINRWLLEPVKIFLISTSSFILNHKNYPVLNKFNQIILWKFIQKKWFNPPILLLHGVDKDFKKNSINNTIENDHPIIKLENGEEIYLGDLAYLNYLKFISKTNDKNLQLSPIELFTNDRYSKIFGQDSLQVPLQPLQHNLDNITYKIFEKDSIKYDYYERAMIASLIDLLKLEKFQNIKKTVLSFQSSQNIIQIKNLNILIIGPGRGPLIEKLFSSLNFLKLDLSKIKIYAVEKNPNATIYLTQKNQQKWDNKVNIINEDVRFWQNDDISLKFNLVIGELLGSFGCNELSPECFDSVEKWCDYSETNSCIFIPRSYTSYIAPAIAPTVYKNLCKLGDMRAFHRPYIVLNNQFDLLSSKFHESWTFEHPNNISHMHKSLNNNHHNKRIKKLSFKCRHKGMIHGLVGCFEAELYPGISISNNPNYLLPQDLISWLPTFFPLENPIYLSDDQEVEILLKRDFDNEDRKIWYEWTVESFIYLILPVDAKNNRKFLKNLQKNMKIEEGMNNRKNTNSVFGNRDSTIDRPQQAGGVDDVRGEEDDEEEEECQVRVRTGVSRIHNPNGIYHSLRL
ncbi:hypothetical protein PACTADRAFT_2900 [Pachysolen tannophilus NRRL Y-2460]|uniref:Protein arginine N-methyltransferase n=1 Tax=Pachysolen tannophilus NRRL Y-2460 TaxID=669874 RepID=A0A1E4TTR7_PACTA|nr:hypothetical protein PACTADRAFT_2900 [Pachysolen tannophilus NRRL Y-2460]